MKAILKQIPWADDRPDLASGLSVGDEFEVLDHYEKVKSLPGDGLVYCTTEYYDIMIPKKYLDILDDDEGIPGPIPEPKKRPIPFEDAVAPRIVHDQNRLNTLYSGINRCLCGVREINIEWVEEYNELIDKVKSRK